jgi:hypothetical protein
VVVDLVKNLYVNAGIVQGHRRGRTGTQVRTLWQTHTNTTRMASPHSPSSSTSVQGRALRLRVFKTRA